MVTATPGNPGHYPTRRSYVGLRIAYLRDAAGLTQQMLADRVGIGREYVSMIENGRRQLSRYSLLRTFAKALGVEPSALAEPYDSAWMPVAPSGSGPVLDLRSLRASVRRGPAGELRLVVAQGSMVVEFSGGPVPSDDARRGAHRLADAALRFTLDRPDPEGHEDPPNPEDLPDLEDSDGHEDASEHQDPESRNDWAHRTEEGEARP